MTRCLVKVYDEFGGEHGAYYLSFPDYTRRRDALQLVADQVRKQHGVTAAGLEIVREERTGGGH